MPFPCVRFSSVSFSRLRKQLEQRLYATTPPRPVRRVAYALGWRLRRIARPAPVSVEAVDLGEPEVVAYFAEGKSRLYQLQQWVPVLERLHAEHPVLVVTRSENSWRYVTHQTKLVAALVPTFRDLYALYDRVDPKLALYVNNGSQNFQSLSSPRMLHVHINHGESDKLSMVSNQAKAYDRVFVAGEAAILRHRAALLDMDESKLIRVGRPQLDLDLPPVLQPNGRRTIVYAPTWEGENEYNNYTSVDRYGRTITAAALATEGTRLVYKPHPRVRTSKLPAMLDAHDTICRLITEAARRQPDAGHVIADDSTNVLALLRQADLLISDVSSVTLDYLYLRNECPLLLTDRRSDRRRLLVDAPLSAACDVIDEATAQLLPHLLSAALHDDSYRVQRQQMREFYFGDLQPGESTMRFLDEVDALIRHRDEGLRARGTLDVHTPGNFGIDGERTVDENMEEAG